METIKDLYFEEANKYASLCAEYEDIDEELSLDYESHFLEIFKIISELGWSKEYMGI